jgi:hypothetical protein
VARLAPGAKVTHQGANRVIRIAEPLRDVAEGAVVGKEGPQRFVLAVEGLRGFLKEALTRRIIHGWASSVRVDSGWALGLIVGRWRAASKGRGRADPSRNARIGPRNEKKRGRRGSRGSGNHEESRASVRPERTLTSIERHREKCGIVLPNEGPFPNHGNPRSKVVPEVLKNLAAGAMTARRAEPQVEEQEIEEYDEETEEDEVEEA